MDAGVLVRAPLFLFIKNRSIALFLDFNSVILLSDNRLPNLRSKFTYRMRPMRKAKRQRDGKWALEVFDKAPYVTVSMVRSDGTPYGLPLSLVRRDDSVFYFHCAHEGEKLECLKNNPVVSLSAVSKCTPKYEEEKNNFTEYYHSAVAVGRAEIVDDDNEKTEALRLICERFLPRYMDHFDEAVGRSLNMTAIVKITLTEAPVGKCKP